ncbi:MAG: nucleotide exchange factor GrpE [Vicinamibacterales bacterium]
MADKHGAEPAAEAPEAGDPRATREQADATGAASPLVDLQRERDDLYDRLLRKSAEFDNYRKRIERERREQADQAVTDLLLELLSAVDDFDRALTVDAGPGAAAYRKGIELIHAKLHDLLRKYDVRPIDALGTDFDPNLHQAVMHEASPDHREGKVIGELQRGYLIHGRLLRPAMVKVAKA